MRRSEFENAGNNTPACDQRDQIPIQIIRRLFGKPKQNMLILIDCTIVPILSKAVQKRQQKAIATSAG